VTDTRVGHWIHDDCDHYVGRGRDGRQHLGNSLVGARGWLGNPHKLEDDDVADRHDAVEKFRADFEARPDASPEFRAAVADLQGEVLGCWCQRLDADGPACHAEVIAEWADRLAEQEGGVLTDGGREQSPTDQE